MTRAAIQTRPTSLLVEVRASDVDQLIVALWHSRRILARWMVGKESRAGFRFTADMVERLERLGRQPIVRLEIRLLRQRDVAGDNKRRA